MGDRKTSGHIAGGWVEIEVMKSALFAIGAGCAVAVSSCSSMDLGGQVPLPFTDPATAAKLELDLRPLPPRFCIGLDLVPSEGPIAESEATK